MKLILIALRNLNRQKKRTFLLGGAIAFGILIVTVINGFAGSFVRNVGENFSYLLAGHVFVEGLEKNEKGKNVGVIRDDAALMAAVDGYFAARRGTVVRSVTKRSEFMGTFLFQGMSVAQNVVGADWAREAVLKERINLVEGSFEALAADPRGIILSRDVADRLKLRLRDRFLVKMRTLSGQQNVGEFTLAAVSYDPGLFGSLAAYANLPYVNELLDLKPGQYISLGILLDSMNGLEKTADGLYGALQAAVPVFEREPREEKKNSVMAMFRQPKGEEWEGTKYRFFTLNDVMDQVQQIVDLLNSAALVILVVLFFIIMVGITNTFRMIMIERVKEIGTMRALGLQRDGVLSLFLLEALLLALGGAVAGHVLAAAVMTGLSFYYWGLDSFFFILLKNGYMTFTLSVPQVLLNVAIVAGLTIVAALLPARAASLMKPVDALRS